jgi:hypothetical protein
MHVGKLIKQKRTCPAKNTSLPPITCKSVAVLKLALRTSLATSLESAKSVGISGYVGAAITVTVKRERRVLGIKEKLVTE